MRPPRLLTTVLLAGAAVSASGQASCDPCTVGVVSNGGSRNNSTRQLFCVYGYLQRSGAFANFTAGTIGTQRGAAGIANRHNEGGKRMTNETVSFQVHPHPLAE